MDLVATRSGSQPVPSSGDKAVMDHQMEGKLDRKKFFIVCEVVIGLVFILCYWIFDIGMLFSLIACLPIVFFSIYLLANPSKGGEDKVGGGN
jgi:hypothetical protein